MTPKRSKSRQGESPDNEDPLLVEAAQRVQRARQELEQAQAEYDDVCRQLAGDNRFQEAEEQLSQWISATLQWVSRHPGPGVLGAGLAGFFLGRWTRR